MKMGIASTYNNANIQVKLTLCTSCNNYIGDINSYLFMFILIFLCLCLLSYFFFDISVLHLNE